MPLVTINQRDLERHVRGALEAAPDLPILGAYLFGSATKACRPDSDIDVALIPARGTPQATWALRGEAERGLAPFAQHPVDVSVLSPGCTC